MPTVLRVGPYRFFFYASDRNEPQHVHVERDDNLGKFWLDAVRVQRNVGFRAVKLRRIQEMVGEQRIQLQEAWDEYFNR